MLSVTSPLPLCTDSTISSNNQPLISFDDILDIAREFEFASTITYITEIEETNPISLEYLFATMFTTEKAEECPIPTSTPRLTLDRDRDRIQDCEWQMSTRPSPDSTEPTLSETPESCHSSPVHETRDLAPLRNNSDEVRIKVGDPHPARLLGWSPPDGSQSLELDDDLLSPKALLDNWYPPWLAKLLAQASNPQEPQPQSTSPAIQSANDNGQSQKQTPELQEPSTSRTGKGADDHQTKTVPPASPQDPIPPSRPVLPSVKAEFRVGTTERSSAAKSFVTPDLKPLKLRLHPLSVPTTVPSAPRGGVPPHIARSVTKANTLRAEKEGKMAKTSSKGFTGDGKKPSVLRTAGKKVREPRKVSNGGGGGKTLFAWDDDEGRVTKRTRM